ncbi:MULTISPECIES: HdeD family acid-resistance protein [Streptomyces]|uniref:HdeD family acid-resistance protein n=2 Tax=Streptomyces TaxID=1883 RepID=A0A100Y509_9ACTN|nr:MULTISPECIES: DUF308 domain-containing protein [Streptomyces]KUH37755.1 hypothetical protein ATE80_16565 [Streptomyces kanasensis]UUS34367.1 DUF308 domain-containing protein [Streptomyces changanensis]
MATRRLTWTLALRAAAALLFGLLAVTWPGVTVVALALLFGAYVLVDGIAMLVDAFRRHDDRRHRALHALAGGLGVATGLVALAWPGVTALALTALVGVWAVVTGAAEIWAAVRFHREVRHEWLLALAGAASVVAGVLLWLRPDIGAVAVAQVIGVYALITGALVGTAAWRLYSAARHAGAPRRRTHHAHHPGRA